jgi:fumarate hydratase class II
MVSFRARRGSVVGTVARVSHYPSAGRVKPAGQLWGPETDKAVANFPISGRPFPAEVIAWLAELKRAAAAVNAELGLLDDELAAAIGEAARAVAAGDHAGQFPIDVFQTGSGTSSNMNVNEVISALTGGAAHPNDHVNMGQSSNDAVPTAVHLAACAALTGDLLPALDGLIGSLRRKAAEFADVVVPGRTHLMDAVPVLLGDRFAAFAEQLAECAEQVASARTYLARVPLGGTAVGNGLGAHPEFARRVVARLDAARLGVAPVAADDTPGRMARQAGHDAIVGTSGALNTTAVALTKVCNDLRWMGSGPSTGLAELALPALQKGSSIMPGKVNPVIPEVVLQVAAQVIGNHTTITVAGMQGNFELNVTIPVMALDLLESIELLAAGCRVLAQRCVDGITADAGRGRALAARSPALATALNPVLGYDRVEAIVKHAAATGGSIRDAAVELGADPALVDAALDLDRVARGDVGSLDT